LPVFLQLEVKHFIYLQFWSDLLKMPAD